MLTYPSLLALARVTVRGGVRNRLFLAVFFMGCLVIVGLQLLAGLSMRQPYQAAMAYNLAAINVIGVLLTLFLGVNLICRDVDSRFIHPILAQPIKRGAYIYGQFLGLFFLIVIIIGCLGLCGGVGLALVEYFHPDMGYFSWLKFILAIGSQIFGLSLLGAVTIFFASFASSSILPFLLSCGIYTIGLIAKATKEFLETPYGQQNFTPLVKKTVIVVYYTLPNFSFFDINQQAIYNLPLELTQINFIILYWFLYCSALLCAASLLFKQRDIT
jgi:ABC-type transport system involved in multi-copper enzyme maturation permease subunit